MEIKNIIIFLIILSFFGLGFLFFEEQQRKESVRMISEQEISPLKQQSLCSNGLYSTIYYPSAMEDGKKRIRLDTESLILLKSRINGNDGIIPEESFAGLDCIQELEIMETNLRSLEGIGNLPALEVLNLQSNNLSDLSPLIGAKNLKMLNLNQNYGVSDLSPLSGLSSLEQLFLSYSNVKNVSALSSLINLQELSLSWTKVEDVSPLKTLVNLKTLYTRHVLILSDNLKTLKDNTDLVIIKN